MKNRSLYLRWQVVKLGSNANNSGNTEAAYWNANNTSSNDNINISAQISLYNLKDIKTMPLGKTQITPHKVLVGLSRRF